MNASDLHLKLHVTGLLLERDIRQNAWKNTVIKTLCRSTHHYNHILVIIIITQRGTVVLIYRQSIILTIINTIVQSSREAQHTVPGKL